MLFQYKYNDGGREAAGYHGRANDCSTRAIAIATGQPYQVVYDTLNALGKADRVPGRGARTGIGIKSIHQYMARIGWSWTPTMRIGQGCRVHLAEGELPYGCLVARLSHHLVAVIGRTVHDTYDPRREGTRCVYGYWQAGGIADKRVKEAK